MTLAKRGLAIGLHVSVFALLPSRIQAQEACPRASGAATEAGWAGYAANDMETARARFEAALVQCPSDHYARTGLGYVSLRTGDVARAASLWNAVVSAEPNNVDALTGLGLAAWRMGDLETARDRFTRVIELVPDDPTALDYLARLEGDGASRRPADPADQAWARGETELALRLYEAHLAADPGDDVATLRVALMRAWRAQYDAGLELLDGLVARAPADMDARLAGARVRACSGDLARAQAEVLEVLAVEPDNAEALEALALFQGWAGDLEESLGTYDALSSIAPESRGTGQQRAQTLAWAADFHAATAAYRALLDRDPGDLEARLGLAQTLAYAQDFDASVAEYDQILASSPREIRGLSGKARALGWAGRLVEAERVADQAVAADRSSAVTWAVLGQLYRWQGREADAKQALETAARLMPTNAEVADQLRSVNLAFAPRALPTVVHERDSDDNRMTTTAFSASWYASPRFEVRGSAYYKHLEQGIFARTAAGATVSGQYELQPGWLVSAGLGGSRSNGVDDPTFAEFQVGVRSPGRYAYGGALSVSSIALNETAALAQRGVRSSQILLSARWAPARLWRVDGSVGVGRFTAAESNGRRSGSLSASRRVGRFFSLGASVRGFSFEKDLDEGYFDPDFYGVAEATSYWLYRPGPWTLLVELAPGLQRVRTDGDTGTSLRSNVRVAYGFGPGREVSLAFGYSSAGLVSFATGSSGYTYTAFILGSRWAF